MNEASVYLLKQNNGTKEIFSNNFFLSTFESYHPLRENDPYILFRSTASTFLKLNLEESNEPRRISKREKLFQLTIWGTILSFP